MVLILLLLSTVASAQFAVNYYYSTNTCSGTPVGIDTSATGCTPGSLGSCISGKRSQCASSVPVTPSGMAQLSAYSSGTCGTLFGTFSATPGTCIVTGSLSSYQMVCNNGAVTLSSYSSSAGCVGTQGAGFPIINSGTTCATCLAGSMTCRSTCVASGASGAIVAILGILLCLVL
jgi:hypothetical protein